MGGPVVLVTRAEPGASATASRLRQLGYTPLMAPAFALRPRMPWPDLAAHTAGALAFTSALGVHAFAAHERLRDIPVWAVGDATAAAAHAEGFGVVRAGPGDGQGLAHLMLADPEPPQDTLVTGHSEGAFDLAAALRSGGLRARFIPTYDAVDTPEPAPKAALALQAPAPVGVLIHSRRAAEVLARWLRANPARAPIHVAAISASASEPLKGLPWAGVWIAAQPTETALIAALADALPPIS